MQSMQSGRDANDEGHGASMSASDDADRVGGGNDAHPEGESWGDRAGEGRAARRGWYLRCREGDIAERVVLVGDPGRVELFARHLRSPRTVNTNRAMLAVTGRYGDMPVSVVSFGMGAPVLAVVLEEVVWLGARVVLRAGTAMSVAPGWYGSFIVADAALRYEATSATYVPTSYPAVADHHLVHALCSVLDERGLSWGRGTIASFDGFYSEMFALNEHAGREHDIARRRNALRELGVAATDMETSALLAIGRYLGVQCGSLCLVTVDGASRLSLDGPEREEGERNLVLVSLEALGRCVLLPARG